MERKDMSELPCMINPIYHCWQCRKRHRISSRVGREHFAKQDMIGFLLALNGKLDDSIKKGYFFEADLVVS